MLDDLRNYIVVEVFHGKPPIGFTDQFDLIESGVMDSLVMMNLITWVSGQYSVEFGPNDLVPKNLNSVYALSQFIEAKLPSGHADQN